VSGRALPRSRLDNLIPSLVEAQALIALVPATGNLHWAGAAAWDTARAATRGGRRVALVDLLLETPTLHEVVGVAPTDGIVDAFEFGVSLNKTAHQVDGVFFIAAGSNPAHTGDVFGNPRWRKLHAGFRVEGALLLLYVSAGGLARLSAVPDGLIALSPDGYEPESSIGQGITAAMERGIPLLGVVRERWTPSPAAAPAVEPPPHVSRGSPASPALQATAPKRRARTAVVAVTIAAGVAGGWVLFAIASESLRTPRDAATRVAPLPRRPLPPPVAAAPAPHVDSLPWTVQLAAYGTFEKALALADRLAEQRRPTFVAPVALAGGATAGTVWYRVLVGAYGSRDSAAAARAALWRRGAAARGQGELLRAPYSLALADPSDPDRLRARGIAAVRWGTGGLLVGAFETPEQAAVAEAQLKRAGIAATLVTRVGTSP
jgi:hypothetical protein